MPDRVTVQWNPSVRNIRFTVKPRRSSLFFLFISADRGKQEKKIHVRLGKESAVRIYGVVLTRKNADLRIDLSVSHEKPSSTSFVSLKGIALDESRAIVNGTIHIVPVAQKSDARLEERLILLSPTARAESIPNLEIEAHDVKASHAATVSKLSDDELFYLATRGLSIAHAKRLLVHGFLRSQLAALPQSRLRDKLEAKLTRKLSELSYESLP